MQNISLYVPFVKTNKETLFDVLENEYELGKISHIHFVCNKTSIDMPYHSAYIYFQYWNDNISAKEIQSRILSHPDKMAYIIYDEHSGDRWNIYSLIK